jgi:hypothetical protein
MKWIKFKARMPKGRAAIVIETEGDQEALQHNIDFWGKRGYTVIEKAEVFEK